jgi:hypothetical protein
MRILLALALMTTPALAAEDVWFKSWSVGATTDNEFIYATTVNDSGALLGEYCSRTTQNCMWVLGMNTRCDKGSKTPVLSNSQDGASTLEVYCDGFLSGQMYRYAFTDFDAITQVVKAGGQVGFAFPMQEGSFRVSRFLVDGAPDAVAYMENLVTRQQQQQKAAPAHKQGTRDQDI